MSTEHPRHNLVDEFTNPVRFSLVAGLAGVEQIDFATLRNHLQVSDSVLSRQASQLEGLGIVAVRKGYIGKRPRTWFSLTPKGRKLWKSHLAALRAIAEGSVPTTSGEGPARFPATLWPSGQTGWHDHRKIDHGGPRTTGLHQQRLDHRR